MQTILAGVIAFTTIIMSLVLILTLARLWLVKDGEVDLTINGNKDKYYKIRCGDSLLNNLAREGIYIASACGGKGSCGACKVLVNKGGGSLLSIEKALISKAEARRGMRLACQLHVKQEISITLPDIFLKASSWPCKVISNHNIGAFIKELVVELPNGQSIDFSAGGYVQIECPPYQLDFCNFIIDKGYRTRWDEADYWQLSSINKRFTQRSYSLANNPEEKSKLMFNIRLAAPPKEIKYNAPPGIVSSYLFSLKPGDLVNIRGPFGNFMAKNSEAEMLLIGGGVGMAPLRSIIFDQLKGKNSQRKISYWYGARSLNEVFYEQDFNLLKEHYSNFKWTLALSEPQPEDQWRGASGYIHEVVFEQYLKRHPAPEDVEYYLCGPPLMIKACVRMLDELGVEEENIFRDEFG